MAISSALVVDDSKSARYSLRKMLEKMDVAVAFAESGEQAIESLGDSQPDVIFMDHMMPGMDGLETTQAIKNNPDWSKIPVVMCTSKDGDEYTKEAKSHGAVAILPKPASLKQLSEMLDSLEQLVALMPEPEMPEPQSAIAAETSATETATKEVALPIAQIEELVQKAVQEAIAEAVRTTVTAVVQDVVQEQLADHARRIHEEVLNSAAEKAEVISRQLVESQVSEARASITTEVQSAIDLDSLKSTIGRVQQTVDEQQQAMPAQMKDIATQIASAEAESRVNTMSQQLLTPITSQLETLKTKQSEPSELSPEQMKAVKHVASQEATQEAKKVATEAAKAAQQLAKDKATQITQQLLDSRSTSKQAQQEQLDAQIKENNQSLLSRTHLLFFLAAGIGIAAAAVVFMIK